MDMFERLSKFAFQPRFFFNIPIISHVLNLFFSYFFDGRYSADNLEAALQEVFGNNRSLIDFSRATAAGTRVGFPVTTIQDTSTCVFTNYNGIGKRPEGCGKAPRYWKSSGCNTHTYRLPRFGS
jgi:hypothetical protein